VRQLVRLFAAGISIRRRIGGIRAWCVARRWHVVENTHILIIHKGRKDLPGRRAAYWVNLIARLTFSLFR
jgi:hypothetical protein